MLQFNFSPFPILQTNRLTLRRINQDDAAPIFKLRSDQAVLEFTSMEPALIIDDAESWISRINEFEKDNMAITWGIIIKESKELAGTIGLWHLQPQNFRAEIGYALLPKFQKRGLMNEATQAVLEYSFNDLNLHSLEAHVNPKNEKSIRLLDKNNFLKEAHFREDFYHKGEFYDSLVFSLLKSRHQANLPTTK